MINLKEKANGAIEQLYAYGECLNESTDKSKVSVCLVKAQSLKNKVKKIVSTWKHMLQLFLFFLLKVFCVGVKQQGWV